MLTSALLALVVTAEPLLTHTSPAWINASLGRRLDGTGPQFPTPEKDDPTLQFATAPDLSPVAALLGPWLDARRPPDTSRWVEAPRGVTEWAPNDELAAVYPFTLDQPARLVARFGVDNGVFVWLDGHYLFGAIGPGAAYDGEYTVDFGVVAAGTHHLQLLLEDHGVICGFRMDVQSVPGGSHGQRQGGRGTTQAGSAAAANGTHGTPGPAEGSGR